MEESEISSPDAYMIGIEADDFLENVEEARIFRPSALSAEQSLCIVVAKSRRSADELFEEMCESYEWAPCDPARSAVFMQYGNYILLGKDSADGAKAISDAFAAETDGGARAEFSQNPM